jgi:hypothetical protein
VTHIEADRVATTFDASDFETELHVRGEVLHHRYLIFGQGRSLR